jgi:hypothetical protein
LIGGKPSRGGFRFVVYTDHAGEPQLGIAHLSPAREMIAAPRYTPAASMYFIEILQPSRRKQAFIVLLLPLTRAVFFVAVRKIPSIEANGNLAPCIVVFGRSNSQLLSGDPCPE